MSEEKKSGGMTVAEAGRLGGSKVAAKYGSAHMAKIGAMGGAVTPSKFTAGDARNAEIASKGGKASGGNFAKDPSRAAEAGRRGGQKRWANKRAAGWVPDPPRPPRDPNAPVQLRACTKCRRSGHNRKTCDIA